MEEKLKQIMYGVTDFERMIRENAYFVDRTALIPELEMTCYTMFLRPRGFGKSLLCSILKCYYDVNYADRFDELFGGLDIGKHPTAEHNSYLVLDFNFSVVEKRFEKAEENYDYYCSQRIEQFVKEYAEYLPKGVAEKVLAAPGCHRKFNTLMIHLSGSGVKIYVIIDEYDNFTNTILSESRESDEELYQSECFLKQFFVECKGYATGACSPIDRIFITGVTPVSMDDVTSGFNIAANISLQPFFANFTGFTHADIKTMLAYYRANAGFDFDEEAIFELMRRWYGNYCFAPDCYRMDMAENLYVANPALVLFFMQSFLQTHSVPEDLVDENLRTDYMKIRHIITEGRQLNRNYHRLEEIITNMGIETILRKSFQARELGTPDNFVSFLFYNGLISIADIDFYREKLGIPNLTVGEIMHDFIVRAYNLFGIDSRVFDIANYMTDFSRTGEASKALDTACEVVSQYWKVRDAVDGEHVVQTAMCALLYVGHGPYIVHHELEENTGFVDFAFEPQLSRWPQIAHAALVELKYIKPDEKVSRPKLSRIKKQAIAQLECYAKDNDLNRAWNLRGGDGCGIVTLHRFVIVFHGAERLLCEEV